MLGVTSVYKYGGGPVYQSKDGISHHFVLAQYAQWLVEAHNHAWNVHIRRMIRDENILPAFVVRGFIDLFVPDTNEKIPYCRPNPADPVHQVTRSYFAKKKKKRDKYEHDYHQRNEDQQSINTIDDLEDSNEDFHGFKIEQII